MKKQNEITALVFNEISQLETVDFVDFYYPDIDTNISTAVARIAFDDEEILNVIFSLCSQTNIVFITITDGDSRQVAKIISSIEYYVKYENTLEMGDSLSLIDSDFLVKNNVYGAVLLKVSVIPFLPNFPYSMELSTGESISTMLVTFINKKEYMHIKQNGFTSLVDYFADTNKDLYSLQQ